MSTLDEKLQTISQQVDVLKARIQAMEKAARLLLNDFKKLRRHENEEFADRSGAVVRSIPGTKAKVSNAAR